MLIRAVLTALLTALALPATALAGPADPPRPAPVAVPQPTQVQATRTDAPPRLDGTLDDAAWGAAAPFDGFVQISPAEGAPPAFGTVLRVMYDDDFLYVGVECADPDPAAISRPLGRRDAPASSDMVQVVIDSEHDHRNAFVFAVTAAGVLQDALMDVSDRVSTDWDGVWEGAARVDGRGWSAELAIPLRLLRFGSAPSQTWGFAVQRDVARTHETQLSTLVPRGTRGKVARLGHLVGLEDVAQRRGLELAPYVASRVVLRPQYSDAERPLPRLADPIAELGLDLRGRIGQSFTLDAALNPDFGQVEADQIILNLSRFETFFPEKRPFFTEGTAFFRPPWQGGDNPPHQLFYTRRIGLDAPILGAVKLAGRASDRVEVGLVEALVTGAAAPAGTSEDRPGRRLFLDAAQPFRFAPGSAYPALAPVPRNFLAAVVRARATPHLVVGAQAASAQPFGASCTEAEDLLDDDARPRRCDTRAGHAAALDLDVRSAGAAWGAFGQLSASRSAGGPPVRTFSDGTLLRRGDSGAGGYVRAGKFGGDPWRLDLRYEYASPRLDLNATGFQRAQNDQAARAMLAFVRPRGGGPFLNYDAFVLGQTRFSTDGRGLEGVRSFWAGGNAQLAKPYLAGGCEAGLEEPNHDLREIEGSGIPLVRAGWWQGTCWIETDRSRLVSGVVQLGGGRNFTRALLRPVTFWSGEAQVALRPHSRAETKLELKVDRSAYAIRWLEDDGAGTHLFGELTSPSLSATVRQLFVVTPRLTVQAYAQLFSAFGRYGPFYSAVASGTAPIRPADLRPAARADASEDPDFHETGLNHNLVARWEYRRGSTLFLVYAREASELPLSGGAPVPHSLAPRALATGPTTDSVMLKWTYWTVM